MARNYVISERDYQRLQEMLRWYDRNKNIRHPMRRRNISGGGSLNIKIFAVQSEAAGDGVYNCYEQTLDGSEWDDTTGAPKSCRSSPP